METQDYRGMVEAGAVFDPLLDECFSAVAGGGAYCNGRRLATSPETELSRALVAVSFPTRIDPANSPEVAALLAMIPHCQAFRRMGSAALNLCYVAAGRLDAFFERGLQPWDFAAGALVAAEAGAVVSDLANGPPSTDIVVASAPSIAAEFRRLLAAAENVA